MAKTKPTIRRCLFCGEAFAVPIKDHYKDPIAPGAKANCMHTSTLLAQGWRQSETGVWSCR